MPITQPTAIKLSTNSKVAMHIMPYASNLYSSFNSISTKVNLDKLGYQNKLVHWLLSFDIITHSYTTVFNLAKAYTRVYCRVYICHKGGK